LQRLRTLQAEQRFRIRSENRDEGVALLLRGEADILLAYETTTAGTSIPTQLATACALGEDALVLVASPKLASSEEFSALDSPMPLLCFPAETFFGRAVRTRALPELMQSRLVAVQYVSEFSLGLREMALLNQGAAWLPRSLVAQDLKQGSLQELPAIGREVPLWIKTYFANHRNQALQNLFAKFRASQDNDYVAKA